MIDLFLRADSEAALVEALPMFLQDGKWITDTHAYSLDIIGALYEPAVVESDGTVSRDAVLLPGFHANLRLNDGPDRDMLAAMVPDEIKVTPAQPMRVWAS